MMDNRQDQTISVHVRITADLVAHAREITRRLEPQQNITNANALRTLFLLGMTKAKPDFMDYAPPLAELEQVLGTNRASKPMDMRSTLHNLNRAADQLRINDIPTTLVEPDHTPLNYECEPDFTQLKGDARAQGQTLWHMAKTGKTDLFIDQHHNRKELADMAKWLIKVAGVQAPIKED